MDYQERVRLGYINEIPAPRLHHDKSKAPWPIWYYDKNNEVKIDDTEGPWFPTWQESPVVYQGDGVNENILANKDGLNSGANITFHSDTVSISQLIMAPPGGLESTIPSTHLISLLMSIQQSKRMSYLGGKCLISSLIIVTCVFLYIALTYPLTLLLPLYQYSCRSGLEGIFSHLQQLW